MLVDGWEEGRNELVRREGMTWSGLVGERKEIKFSQTVAFLKHHCVHVSNLFTTPLFLLL